MQEGSVPISRKDAKTQSRPYLISDSLFEKPIHLVDLRRSLASYSDPTAKFIFDEHGADRRSTPSYPGARFFGRPRRARQFRPGGGGRPRPRVWTSTVSAALTTDIGALTFPNLHIRGCLAQAWGLLGNRVYHLTPVLIHTVRVVLTQNTFFY